MDNRNFCCPFTSRCNAKFGLHKNSSSQFRAIGLEVVKEQASALGRAGRKLRLSLGQYQTNQGTDSNLEKPNILEISNNLWELMLQREFLGFTEKNLQWVLANYVIPQCAIDRLGSQKS